MIEQGFAILSLRAHYSISLPSYAVATQVQFISGFLALAAELIPFRLILNHIPITEICFAVKANWVNGNKETF